MKTGGEGSRGPCQRRLPGSPPPPRRPRPGSSCTAAHSQQGRGGLTRGPRLDLVFRSTPCSQPPGAHLGRCWPQVSPSPAFPWEAPAPAWAVGPAAPAARRLRLPPEAEAWPCAVTPGLGADAPFQVPAPFHGSDADLHAPSGGLANTDLPDPKARVRLAPPFLLCGPPSLCLEFSLAVCRYSIPPASQRPGDRAGERSGPGAAPSSCTSRGCLPAGLRGDGDGSPSVQGSRVVGSGGFLAD